MKKGQNLFIVDLTTVSLFNEFGLNKIANSKATYKKTPFLYLIASYTRNYSISWANRHFKYINKQQNGAWMVYEFSYL